MDQSGLKKSRVLQAQKNDWNDEQAEKNIENNDTKCHQTDLSSDGIFMEIEVDDGVSRLTQEVTMPNPITAIK